MIGWWRKVGTGWAVFLAQGSELPEPGDTVTVRSKAGIETQIVVERVAGFSERGEVVLIPHQRSHRGPYCPVTGELLRRARKPGLDDDDSPGEHGYYDPGPPVLVENILGPISEKEWLGQGSYWDACPEYPE